MPVKLLVTGATGQLGREFCSSKSNEFEIVGISRSDVDITKSEEVTKVVREHDPHVVVHTAAITDVDACEEKLTLCHQVNAYGTENLLEAAKRVGARFIYISTDYVFDGTKGTLYDESDKPNPLSVYGAEKLNGEVEVKRMFDNWTIVRTSWVYSQFRKNFVKSVIRQAKAGDTLKVVDDQFGSPTWTKDIVRQVLKIINSKQVGMFHVANKGSVSRYEMAKQILQKLNLKATLTPVSTKEFPRPAKRPKYSALKSERLEELGIDVMRPYNEALDEFLELHGEELLNEIQD